MNVIKYLLYHSNHENDSKTIMYKFKIRYSFNLTTFSYLVYGRCLGVAKMGYGR